MTNDVGIVTLPDGTHVALAIFVIAALHACLLQRFCNGLHLGAKGGVADLVGRFLPQNQRMIGLFGGFLKKAFG